MPPPATPAAQAHPENTGALAAVGKDGCFLVFPWALPVLVVVRGNHSYREEASRPAHFAAAVKSALATPTFAVTLGGGTRTQ